ncbi:LytR family transcriptional regulator [Arthrobacter cheniae]|uniref:LytR family transcriptional regulator n=1 Tax=Arthrobacter cheniae TaxID=1258888 RepID=A0A3A5MDT6_9MICC|nr:LCP family protein [Arthrobacter cheniae]RJT81865.1 LytR family transcriptional regulator [Arthrobacter cheniae]
MSRRPSPEGADNASDPFAATPAEAVIGVAPGSRHLGRARRFRGLKLTAILMASAIVAVVAFVGVQVLRLQSNVDTMPLNLGENQGTALPVDSSTDPLQILILGSDTRTGNSGEFFGSEEDSSGEGNSDVMMLATLSADRQNVTVVSFPRDLLVPVPGCVNPESGNVSAAVDLGQLNEALNEGGPGCTVAAINNLTGLSIDHFMMAGFNAVSELSSAVGGVDVCVEEPVDDEFSGLKLPAGTSEVEGDQALAFLRTRHSFGDGGDIGRIAAQQSFMASLARKVRAEGTLTNLPKLYSIADVITRNLTVDDALSQPTEILKIADRLKNVDLGNMAFVTVPTEPWVEDPNRLVLDEEAAAPLFDALREDRGITEQSPDAAAPAPEVSPSAPETTDAPAVDPATVPVLVVNATTNTERSTEVRQLLLDAGYTQTDTFASAPAEATLVVFGAGYDGAAADLAARFGVPDTRVVFDETVVGVQLQVGADLATGSAVVVPPLGDALEGQTADQITCQASSGL